jgi:phosphoribosylformylglycinamidine synthase
MFTPVALWSIFCYYALVRKGEKMYEAQVKVTLKKTVADPQGLTVKHALESLGFKGISGVRMGKFITIQLTSKDKAKAQEEAKGACEKLLANPIIEDFSFEVTEVK